MKSEGKQESKPNSEHWLRKLGLVSVVLGDLLGYTGAGMGIGYLAWKKLSTPAWVIALSAGAGLVLAFYRIYQISKKEL
jgi:hypothetical protein